MYSLKRGRPVQVAVYTSLEKPCPRAQTWVSLSSSQVSLWDPVESLLPLSAFYSIVLATASPSHSYLETTAAPSLIANNI